MKDIMNLLLTKNSSSFRLIKIILEQTSGVVSDFVYNLQSYQISTKLRTCTPSTKKKMILMFVWTESLCATDAIL